ncbi:hypothetical protein ACFR9U_19615 [Halorientalis brevis]|uniref:Uncharacterized protein n=1 Tax=Halorientalis brevis TaxID=1126241 RepID=A0ABD6CGV9_9EURY|nr:hypothetical protein [Halorientalis brevis]
MDDLRVAPLVGVVASVGFLIALGAPYVLTDSTTGVSAYYASGAINPLLAGLFALITIIVFAAGREGRTDPELAAGVALALGTFIAIIALAWALTVRVDTVAITSNHRWVVTAVAAAVPASAAWFSRALGVL